MSFTPQPGGRLGIWRLVGTLGSGAFATTWAASGPDREPVAIKLLDSPPGDELRALSRVCHPCVVGIQGFGNAPVPYLVLELVPGRTLSRHLARGPQAPDDVVTLLAPLADALAAVHAAGVLHGDIKPDNVIVAEPGRPVLVDFGMAGHRLGGTLTWAAPERTRGEPSSAEADVYALGLLAWALLHGGLPYEEDGLTRAMLRRRTESPTPTRGPTWLRELVASMLDVVPTDRPSATQVADQLADHGASLPSVGPDLVARRLVSTHVEIAGVQEPLQRWVAEGGAVAITGQVQLGRSHALAWAAREAGAAGHPVAWLGGDWSSLQAMLADPDTCVVTTGLPVEPDPALRAALVAAHLQEHGHPGLVVLCDDLDGAPDATRRVVHALATRTSVPVLVASTEVPDGHAEIPLRPWSPDELGALIDGALGRVGGREALLHELVAFAEGRPGPAGRLLVEAVRSGALVTKDHRWLFDASALDDAGARAALRVPPLSPEARDIAALLAVASRELPVQELAEGLGLAHGPADAAVQELVEAALAHVAQGGVALRPSVRAGVREELPPTSVSWRTLVSLLDRLGASPLELAPALAGAGHLTRLVAVGPRAVSALMGLDAAEAVSLARSLHAGSDHPALERALLLALARADEHEEVVERGRAFLADSAEDDEVLVAVANATVLLGDPSSGLELLADRADLTSMAARALAWARSGQVEAAAELVVPPPPEDPTLLAAWFDLRVQLAQALVGGGRLDDALERVTVAEHLGAGTAARAKLLAVKGRVLFRAGSIRSAAEAFLEAAQASGLPHRQSAIVLNNAAAALYLSGEREEAIASWEQATLRFERMGYDTGIVLSQVNLCNALREDGRWERARQCGIRAWDLANRLGLHQHAATAAGNLGDLGLVRERWIDAESWYKRAERLAAQHDLGPAKVELARRRAEFSVRRGDDDALARTTAAIEAAEEHGEVLEAALAHALMAVCAARAEEPIDEHVSKAVEPLRERGAARELARARCWVATALAEAGRTTEALETARRALAYAREVGDVPVRQQAEAIESRVQAVAKAHRRDPRTDMLLDLAVEVTRETDPSALLRRIADATLAVVGAERAFVYLVHDGVPRLEAAVGQNLDPGPSRSILQRALDGREVVATDVEERGDLQAASSVKRMELRAALCLPIADHGEVLGAIYADSTQAGEQELHQMARLLRALASQAAVAVLNARRLNTTTDRARELAELAHDLRAPLATMLMLLDAYADQREPWFAQLSDDLRELAHRSQEMIRQNLDPERRAVSEIDLYALCRRCVALTTPLAAARHLRLALEGEPARVRASQVQMARVIDNLVGNALKYAPEESTIDLSVAADGGMATVSIADRGPGIAADDLARIFEHGFQAPGAAEGYGLGLAACKRIVSRLGGELGAHERVGGGTVVTVRLPLAS